MRRYPFSYVKCFRTTNTGYPFYIGTNTLTEIQNTQEKQKLHYFPFIWGLDIWVLGEGTAGNVIDFRKYGHFGYMINF